jgi:geranylgeranyl pyrophosphate synthase
VQPLDDYLKARREDIESALARSLPASPGTPTVVSEAMRYSLMAGGKRLRPLLTLAAADAIARRAGTPPDMARPLALPAACAIEMIHTYSLIHDDLPAMDDDTLRRGRPTLHVVAGDGMAILAGDGLQAAAFALLAREPASGDGSVGARKLRVIEVIAEAAGPAGMVGGQAIDLQAVRPGPGMAAAALDAAAVEGMHARKTGALIRAAAVAGAIMAGADDTQIAAIDCYAAEIGLAFQIVDDILDVEACSDALGKTAGKDRAAGKPTYPALFGLERSRTLAGDCLARAEDALAVAGLTDSHLPGIARWIVHRRS